ncbi:MAG: bifunctional folylpolyglutamate synthase/dihydrofolate synthase [Ruminococcus sp.]|nr:bifunctional folylpolyglutamate synthase/dihydrofolate synthase [Ruminococcus sp.]
MNYSEIEIYLRQVSRRGIKLGLARVKELANRLGNPQNQVKIIHIAGTNGKGSVGAMLANILKFAGYKTGHFSSPALLNLNDYFRINSKIISDRLLTEIMSEVIFHAEQMLDKPTEFEILAVTAYLLFARTKCEIAVIECCMGGDMDCTNINIKALLAVITNIQKDHCAFLGNTLAEIALHKAGIIKYNAPVLTGEKNLEALQVIKNQANLLHAECYLAENLVQDSNFKIDGTELICQDFGKLYLSLLGLYQPENANLVLNSVKILRKLDINISNQAVKNGLANCSWHGRFEIFSKKPYIIFDGGHNPDGMKLLTESLKKYFSEKSIIIIGIMADKDDSSYAELLESCADSIITVQANHLRALNAELLKTSLQEKMPNLTIISCDSVEQALEKALQNAKYSKQIICLGSLYLYSEFYHAVKKLENLG